MMHAAWKVFPAVSNVVSPPHLVIGHVPNLGCGSSTSKPQRYNPAHITFAPIIFNRLWPGTCNVCTNHIQPLWPGTCNVCTNHIRPLWPGTCNVCTNHIRPLWPSTCDVCTNYSEPLWSGTCNVCTNHSESLWPGAFIVPNWALCTEWCDKV